jgi:hypothetical protein
VRLHDRTCPLVRPVNEFLDFLINLVGDLVTVVALLIDFAAKED